MGWTQVITPNLDPVMYDDNGNVLVDWLGWCANYVRTSFNVAKKIARAWWVWEQSPSQHEDRNFPVGVYFPLYFRYTKKLDNSGDNEWGHTTIAYVNNNGTITIWSSPISRKPYADIWNSIAQVEQKYGSTYVGWSEHVNGTRVIQYIADAPAAPQGGDDMAEKITTDTSRILIHGVMARNGVAGRSYALDGQAGGDDLVGQDLSNALVQSLFLSADGKQWRDTSDPDSVTGINNRLAAASATQATIDQLNATVTSATNDDNATKAQLQDTLGKVTDLTAQLKDATDKAANSPTPVKTVVPDPSTYYSFGQLFKAIVQNAANWFKKK